MAKLRVFSAYDGKLSVFMTPFVFIHLGQALRAWEDLCLDNKSMMSKHPSDFILYEVGEFDEDSGVIVAHNPIRQVATALEVVKRATAQADMFSKSDGNVR